MTMQLGLFRDHTHCLDIKPEVTDRRFDYGW